MVFREACSKQQTCNSHLTIADESLEEADALVLVSLNLERELLIKGIKLSPPAKSLEKNLDAAARAATRTSAIGNHVRAIFLDERARLREIGEGRGQNAINKCLELA